MENLNFIQQSEIHFDKVISKGSTCTVIKAKLRDKNVVVKEFKVNYT